MFFSALNTLDCPVAEAHTNYYDGFVRNCHSTYKETFKTVAFSIKMGQQLSHVGSASVRYAYDKVNYVRCEILKLLFAAFCSTAKTHITHPEV